MTHIISYDRGGFYYCRLCGYHCKVKYTKHDIGISDFDVAFRDRKIYEEIINNYVCNNTSIDYNNININNHLPYDCANRTHDKLLN